MIRSAITDELSKSVCFKFMESNNTNAASSVKLVSRRSGTIVESNRSPFSAKEDLVSNSPLPSSICAADDSHADWRAEGVSK